MPCMTTILLLRHGRTRANADGLLAGWSEGVGLDATGREQVDRLGARLRGIDLAGVVTSPLQRCRETTAAVVADRTVDVTEDERVGECHYGAWTGRPLKDLAREPLWDDVQRRPSTVTFPEGRHPHESIPEMQQRALNAVRDHDRIIRQRAGEDAVWAVVSHGDVIKALLAHALGLPLDEFQSIAVGPASLSAIRLGEERGTVLRMNDHGSDPSDLVPRPAQNPDATVGGGASSAG